MRTVLEQRVVLSNSYHSDPQSLNQEWPILMARVPIDSCDSTKDNSSFSVR
jgi:hypothetical protein